MSSFVSFPKISSLQSMNRPHSFTNGFSNSFFVTNDDSTDNDSYSNLDEDVYPNNFLSSDLISIIEYEDKTENVNESKQKKNQMEQKKSKNKNETNKKKSLSNHTKKPFVLRKGDWKCMNCFNINFGFRKCCNRCMYPKGSFIN